MNNSTYIVDKALPLSQDFTGLKDIGISFIEEHGDYTWTNLNPSDPGITILEQVCYALTELGYCGDFPMGDLLAGPNNKLDVADNFYQAEKILTTSPVTIDDYRKYIIDAIDNVDNVIMYTVTGTQTNCYQVYLLINARIVDTKQIDEICASVTYLLNKSRNLGEIFLQALPLQQVPFLVAGDIQLENESDEGKILGQLEQLLQHFIFPRVNTNAEKTEKQQDVFNGPQLNSWIPTDALGKKRNILTTADLINMIEFIPGVSAATVSGFRNHDKWYALLKEAIVQDSQVISIDLQQSVSQKLLTINGQSSNFIIALQTRPKTKKIQQLKTQLPKVTYREINKYYSIQNTFPDVFAVGLNSIDSNSTKLQAARARQLKGYLTLFDQVLANQFAQLANIRRLFSFKNSLTGSPSSVEQLEAKQNILTHTDEYPAPYRYFLPTYFYQSLYDAPHIEPLLKRTNTFMFDSMPEPKKDEERKSWNEYKLDPYNPYIRGLMESLENENTNLERRNNVLDQLLAHCGESPLVIDQIIKGSSYSGQRLKDKVIFKSLYLQNLELLSYYRMKAYNFMGAKRIPDMNQNMPVDINRHLRDNYTDDFIFDSNIVDEREKLKEQHFIDFSALELKFALLFGLKPFYRHYIMSNFENEQALKLALWLIEQRRGAIFIETGLLVQSLGTKITPVVNKDKVVISGNNQLLILPGFIPQFRSKAFIKRVNLFFQNTIPATNTYNICFASAQLLEILIPAFVKWHNGLIFLKTNSFESLEMKENATSLLNILLQNDLSVSANV